MVVCSVILCCHGAAETPCTHLVRSLRLYGAIAAGTEADVRLHRRWGVIAANRARHDIQHAAHGIRTIEHRGRSAQYLHTVGQQRLVAVRDRVAENTLILWMAVNQYKQLSCPASHAAHVDAAGSTC